ncbi:ADP-glyceromanno-heptose 6-epimerase, partial [Aliarcobacter butzleri]
QNKNGKENIPDPHVGTYPFYPQANMESTTKYLRYEPKFSLEDGIKAYTPVLLKLFKEEVK